ncbi:hypothetical protein HUJ04_007258 [Dendroctonus ponderosae]|nr:hypothetical protein HUJ04_007258 [Dendroctonus ponderosae]
MDGTTNNSVCTIVRCSGCEITQTEFYKFLLGGESLLDFFYRHGVLTCHFRCSCGAELTPKKNARCLKFRCQRRNPKNGAPCTTSFAVFKGTVFHNANLSLEQVGHLVMLYLCRPYPRYAFMCNEMKLTTRTMSDWFSIIREVFIFWAHLHSTQIGGENEVVEIDQSYVGNGDRKRTEKKHSRALVIEGQWIFGGIQRSDGQFFIASVENQTSATFRQIIQEKIRPGSIIVSHDWRASDWLSEEDYRHLKTNHSLSFVDPVRVDHPHNHLYRWSQAKKLIPKVGSKVKEHFLGYMCEALFMKRYPNHTQRFHAFWDAVAHMHTPVAHS